MAGVIWSKHCRWLFPRFCEQRRREERGSLPVLVSVAVCFTHPYRAPPSPETTAVYAARLL